MDSRPLAARQPIGPRRSHLSTPATVRLLLRSSCQQQKREALAPPLCSAPAGRGGGRTHPSERDPAAVWHQRPAPVGPAELEEGAPGGAGQNHGAVVLDGLGRVGPDGHLRNGFWKQRESEPPTGFTSCSWGKRPAPPQRPGSPGPSGPLWVRERSWQQLWDPLDPFSRFWGSADSSLEPWRLTHPIGPCCQGNSRRTTAGLLEVPASLTRTHTHTHLCFEL